VEEGAKRQAEDGALVHCSDSCYVVGDSPGAMLVSKGVTSVLDRKEAEAAAMAERGGKSVETVCL